MMEDKKTRRQENKTMVFRRQGDKKTWRQDNSNVLNSCIHVFLYSQKTNVSYSCIPVFLYSPKYKTMASKSFREVMAWQKAHAFVLAFYKTKRYFPEDEKFALVPQFQRAAVSIAANIAEGYKKVSKADKLRFFNIAQGSLEECRYYIILSHDVGYYPQDVANDMWAKIEEAAITLHSYCEAIKANKGITDEQV